MSRQYTRESAGALLYSLAFIGLAAIIFFGVLKTSTVEASGSAINQQAAVTSPSATFPANAGTLGAIPDGAAGLCGSNGGPRDVTFTVSGMTGTVATVSVNTTYGAPVHTWRGDITERLISPAATNFVVFGFTGSTTAGGCGSSSDLSGTYNFTDTAAGTNWWSVLATPTTPGDYRSTALGGAGSPNPAPVTSLNSAFAGQAPNGTWTLRLTDGGGGDTGSVTAANLTITTSVVVPAKAPVDMNGDGKTDYVVVRNTGGGIGGQITWFTAINGAATQYGQAWGVQTDFFTPHDFDGDLKTDVAIWRPGAAGTAAFYILQSQTNTVRIDQFGQTGDDPDVTGDYDGDGKADIAVYRAGPAPGAQSTWFYKSSLGNNGGLPIYTPWGVNGDFPAPGDYNGDGKYDFVVQRNAGGGQAAFWSYYNGVGPQPVIIWGTPSDVIVPGDYDGDLKTDIAVVRGSGGNILWFVRKSTDGSMIGVTWGASATDFPTQGDYDGDGKTDFAVWRPDVTGSVFYILTATGTASGYGWGANGDYPVANFNSH